MGCKIAREIRAGYGSWLSAGWFSGWPRSPSSRRVGQSGEHDSTGLCGACMHTLARSFIPTPTLMMTDILLTNSRAHDATIVASRIRSVPSAM